MTLGECHGVRDEGAEMADDQNMPDRPSVIAKARRNWLLVFVPIFAAFMFLENWLGFNFSMLLVISLLCSVLLFQRFVNRRTWRSIMWGVYASKD
jgi:hypothetical protein